MKILDFPNSMATDPWQKWSYHKVKSMICTITW
jgi:hypothetical protein